MKKNTSTCIHLFSSRLKRLLFLLFAPCLFLWGQGNYLFAQTAIANGTTGDCTWTLTREGSNYTLTISGDGAMADYSSFTDAPWYYNSRFKTVVIQQGVTAIGNYSFGNSDITGTLTIPNSVTSIGDYAFYVCTKLTSIIIGNSVVSIGNSAFAACRELTGTLTIPNSVISIGNSAFDLGNKLTSVSIGNSVTSIGSAAFGNCSELTGTLTIPNSIISIGNGAFYNCSGLTAINFNAINCTTMGSTFNPVFSGCTSLVTLNIGSMVTNIPAATFYGCNKLTSVIIPESVTSIGSAAFYNCSGLTSITIPSLVTSIGNYAFLGCSGLTTVNFNATNCNTMGSSSRLVFTNCTSLTKLNIGNTVTNIPDYGFSGCSGLNSISSFNPIPPTLAATTFSGVDKSICSLTVSSGSELAYVNDTQWREFMDGYYTLYMFPDDYSMPDAITKYVLSGIVVGELPILTKTDYRFTGWNTEQDGNGTTYTDETVYMATDNTFLYAQWKPTKYTLTFHTNGGSVILANKTITYNTAIGELPVPTKAGHDFVEWNTEQDGSGTVYTAETIHNVNDHVTVYAQWQTVTGIETIEATALQVYPNPFSSTVHLKDAEGSILQVITGSGKVVYSQKITNPDETIPLEHLPTGWYLFCVMKDGKVQTIRVVKL